MRLNVSKNERCISLVCTVMEYYSFISKQGVHTADKNFITISTFYAKVYWIVEYIGNF